MDAKLYGQMRDKLVELLKETTAKLKELSAKHNDMNLPELEKKRLELEEICTKVYEDLFRIALVAKYQGGKSTTFNALADGMEISPRGDGAISTSASVITAWNVEDPTKAGVEVIWRTKEELVQVAAELLEVELTEEDVKRFAGVGIDNIADKLDLDNEEDLKLYRRAVDAKVKKYLDNPADFSIDEFPILFISVVISRYYGNKFIKDEKNKNHKLDTVGSIIRFPKNMGPRKLPFLRQSRDQWERDEVFRKEEFLFAFIREVKCRIHGAVGLRSIGIAVTDCPGLSASAYDSSIAMDVFAHSDAIWYLLRNEALGAAELTDISHAFNAASGKIYATTNMKGHTRRHFEDIIMTDQKSSLEGRGINVELNPYHALLALLAVQGAKIIDGTLDKASIEEIIKDAKRKELITRDATAADVKDAWIKLANACLLDIKPMMRDFAELPEKLSDAGISIVSRESCQDDTLAGIKQYAIDNKADAILRSNGVERAIYAIYEGVEKPLLDREEQARKKVEAVKSKIEEMRTKLERFHENARDILEPLHSNAPDRQLAEDFIDKVVIPAIEREAAGAAAKRIIKQVDFFDRIFNIFGKLLGGEDNVTKEIQKILSEEMRKAVTFRAIGWGKDVDLGKSKILKDTLLKTVDRIRKRLEEIWNEQDSALIISLPPMPTDTNINITMDTDKKLAEMGNANTISNLGVNVGIIVAIATAACVLPVIGPIFTIVASSIVIFIREFIMSSEKERIMEIKNKIIAGTRLLMRGSAEREQVVMELMEKTTSTPRKAYLKIFQTALQAQADAFEAQSKTAVADLDKSEAERERIVKDCNYIRTQEIVPLRKKLQAFREEILELIKETRREK